MLEIKTNQLKTRKKVNIDGHVYIVRRMGNIEQLELSQAMNHMQKLADAEKKGTLTSKQRTSMDEISVKTVDTMVSLFDDGGDQSKSRAMLSTLSDTEIGEMLRQIFEEKEDGSAAK